MGMTKFPNHVDRRYKEQIRRILGLGKKRTDRTGVGTVSLFGETFTLNLKNGFPILTAKKVWFKGVAVELLWFLSGGTNIRPLLEEGVSIWTDWPLQNYLKETGQDMPRTESGAINTASAEYQDLQSRFETAVLEDEEFAEKWGDLGPVYGKQWRRFGQPDSWYMTDPDDTPYERVGQVDQIRQLIEGLKEKPFSRRHVVSGWNPQEMHRMALPPCHYSFQCHVRELDKHESPEGKELGLSLLWNQRSVDMFLGLPFNISSYALLTHLLAKQVGMVPDKLIFMGGDCHIYNNHREQVDTLLERPGRAELPELVFDQERRSIDNYTIDDFHLEGYDPYDTIPAPIAV